MKGHAAACLIVLSLVFGGLKSESLYEEVGGAKWGRGTSAFISDVWLDKILTIYAPTSDAVENKVCKSHSEIYKQAVKNDEPWAWKMLDASSKFPEGVLLGNVIQLGNYDECLEVEGAVPGSFPGQHCIVTIDSSPPTETYKQGSWSARSRFLTLIGIDKAKSNAAEVAQFQWSVCIPSSCTPHDLQAHLRVTLQDLVGTATITVGDNKCKSRLENRELTAGDWVVISLLAIFGVLVVLSTAYDVITENSETQCDFKTAFSVYTNGGKLLSMKQDSDTIQPIHGLRSISMMWVLLGHTYLMHSYLPAINMNEMKKAFYDMDHGTVRNSVLAVDSFLAISGLLVCYGFMKHLEKSPSINIPSLYLHRYIRMTPAFAAMMMVTATVFKYFDNGPLWDDFMTSSQNCKDNWWVGMIYLNNYINVDNMCLVQSWYLGIDMQLFLLAPLILYPLWKYPKIGAAVLGVLIGGGILTSFLIIFLNEYPVKESSPEVRAQVDVPTHTRFTPYLIGIGMGYVMHMTKGYTPKHSPVFAHGFWLLSTVIQLSVTLLQSRFEPPEHEYERWFESLYMTLRRPLWALTVVWVAYACKNGYGRPINALLSWKIFRFLGRLSFCAYLVHVNVLTWFAGATRTPLYLHDRTIMAQFCAVLLITLASALILHLVIEAPIIRLEKAVRRRLSSRKNSVNSEIKLSKLEDAMEPEDKAGREIPIPEILVNGHIDDLQNPE